MTTIAALEIATYRLSTPDECLGDAIRSTWELVERAARDRESLLAWRAAMEELRGARGTCGDG